MTAPTQTAVQAPYDDVPARISAFVADHSIEITPAAHWRGELKSSGLPSGRDVYVAHPPNAALDDVLEAAIGVQNQGYNAVPHLIARRIVSVSQLEDSLKRLQQAGISRLLIVAGDTAHPDHVFDSTLDVFYTGMLERYGFTDIGFAGHPEGNRSIGASVLKKALADKLAYAAQSPSRFYILTQFGFDAGAVIAYERAIREMGHDIPIHVGMVGITQMKKLLIYAARCGVRSSLGLLMDRSDIMRGMLSSASDGLIHQFAEHQIAEPDCLFAKAHFFAFGSLEATVKWAKDISEGQFELTGDKGFRVTE